MHNLLSKLFEKRGIKDVNDLDEEERITFEHWNNILSKETLSITDIKEYCQTQLDIISSKWASYDLESSRKAELIPYFSVYSSLLKVMDAPQLGREALEKQLNELIK